MPTPPGMLPSRQQQPLGGNALSTASRDTSFDESRGRRFGSSMANVDDDMEEELMNAAYERHGSETHWSRTVCCTGRVIQSKSISNRTRIDFDFG